MTWHWYGKLQDPIPEPELQPVPRGWAQQPEQKAKHLEALKRVLAMDFPEPDRAQGRGIVYVGGGAYWPGIVVGIRLLRLIGCQLPVQVWHRGDKEPVQPDQVEGLNVQIINSEQHARRFPCRILRGWEQKLFALVHCGWEQVLFLDADAYCVEDPEPLFTALKMAPFAFWEDLGNTIHNIQWPIVWPAGHERVLPPVQGGQLIIDRVKAWRLLLAAHWMCQHSDFYFQHMFGDQDTWRTLLVAMGDTKLWHKIGMAHWKATAFLCGLETDLKPRIVHRCQGKLMDVRHIPPGRRGYNSPQWVLPREKQVFGLLTEALKGAQDPTAIFGSIYEKSLWGAKSGSGSQGQEAASYVSLMNTLFRFGGTSSVVDLGCGDGVIGSELEVPSYIGIDCHAPHIQRLREEHPDREWRHLDFYHQRNQLPGADVALLKDVLHHWPNEWIHSWLSWAIASKKWKRIFLTQDVNQPEAGMDTFVGGYRALHPTMAPLAEFAPKSVVHYAHKAVLLLEP